MKLKQLIKTAIKRVLPKSAIGAYHLVLTWAGAVWFWFPSRKIKVIGVTGTNGKSTTAMMIATILSRAGFKTAVSSSIEFRIGDRVWKNRSRMTMPGRFALQKFLRRAADENCRYAVVEVSSEGIAQHRHRFIRFEAAALTNLTPEHIESHGGFDNYRAAKGKFFAACRNIHVINGDDPNCEFFAAFPAARRYVYGIRHSFSDRISAEKVTAAKVDLFPAGSSFESEGLAFKLRLPGEFNIYNALAAIAVARSQGVPPEACRAALESIGTIPGRMEKVFAGDFEVLVDYAVTPDSLEKAYETARRGLAGKLICVLGACGGGRDRWKRPAMGHLAQEYCDRIFITSEDPYDEDPERIIQEIADAAADARRITDRKEAIHRALKAAERGDRVIITGKGCEDSMCLAGGRKIPWSDKDIVLEYLEKSR
ncbi:MAG: UDP-N-acetylmuramoyl-L-alanyl-D-glutamate--2,6-diaminopimelate ligase [Candidatus Omnitrophica bacterium]|nr:UDP-N-acetylmuramoyl-L-alanyl-D-glutamate--2,6-diaminopimelate ligase [Candidatus Omnitrophota bacterium]